MVYHSKDMINYCHNTTLKNYNLANLRKKETNLKVDNLVKKMEDMSKDNNTK